MIKHIFKKVVEFELLYLIAEIRGLFPETRELPFSVYNLSKSEVKKICDQTGWIPYRVAGREVEFISREDNEENERNSN